jgi:hypothetical protein
MFGIEPLGVSEPDDSPPLERAEAIQLAMAAAHLSPGDVPNQAKVFVATYPETDDTRHEIYLPTKHDGNHVTISGNRVIRSVSD